MKSRGLQTDQVMMITDNKAAQSDKIPNVFSGACIQANADFNHIACQTPTSDLFFNAVQPETGIVSQCSVQKLQPCMGKEARESLMMKLESSTGEAAAWPDDDCI